MFLIYSWVEILESMFQTLHSSPDSRGPKMWQCVWACALLCAHSMYIAITNAWRSDDIRSQQWFDYIRLWTTHLLTIRKDVTHCEEEIVTWRIMKYTLLWTSLSEHCGKPEGGERERERARDGKINRNFCRKHKNESKRRVKSLNLKKPFSL